jgi:hypothetical protein
VTEIQIFDPLDVARRERDEARAELRNAAATAGRALAENARLVAQLAQDAPIAAAARSFVSAGVVDAAALLALRRAVLGEPKCIGAAGLGCELPAEHVGPHLNPSYRPAPRRCIGRCGVDRCVRDEHHDGPCVGPRF